MKEKIRYKKLEKDDAEEFRQCQNLMVKIFEESIGEERFNNKKIVKLFIRNLLLKINYIEVAKVQGKIIGIIFVRINGIDEYEDGFMDKIKNLCSRFKIVIEVLMGQYGERVNALRLMNDIKTWSRLHSKEGVGEVYLLGVDNEYINLDVNSKLMSRFLRKCRAMKVENIYLHANSTSDCNLYYKFGFSEEERIYNPVLSNIERENITTPRYELNMK